MRVIAIIPAYNEEETIENVIKETKKYVDNIIVINDGSTDNTEEIAKRAGAKVVSHALNRGVGAAVRTGYKVALLENANYTIQIDGDGQHNADYIPDFIKTAEEGYDIVIGSRFLNNSNKNFNFVRRSGIKFFSVVANVFGNSKITDVTSGYRLYTKKALESLSENSDKHWAVEQTLEASKKNLRIKEISVKMIIRKKGFSQFNFRTYFMYPLRMIETVLKVLIYR